MKTLVQLIPREKMKLHSATLKKLQAAQELVDIYRDDLDSESLTGIITDFSDDFLLLSVFTDEGMAGGFSIVFREDITRVRWGSNALDAMKALICFHQSQALSPSIPLSGLNDILASVQSQFGYINVHAERMHDGVCFIGEIEEMDEHTLLLHEYGVMANRDQAHLLLAMDQITRIDAEAGYEKNLRYLFTGKY